MLKQGALSRAFTWLESGPVTMITTKDGRKNNVFTISWTLVLDFTPRLAIVTGAWNHSFDNILKNKECVICVPGADLLETTVRVGSVSSTEVDKFKEFNLKTKIAALVQAPLLADCLACVECKLVDYVPAHNLLVFDGVKLWENSSRKEKRVAHAIGDGAFVLDGTVTTAYREIMADKVPAGSLRIK
ncbi:MAG: flavin reductase family protein [Acidaminococcaceae bacterium]|jgi:flavin reductase (DIM6/NTAB) family NADH-FMN oxidoreductase RutF|nr:flavin reductase family protein [Acidaminococcaceae bacterium]